MRAYYATPLGPFAPALGVAASTFTTRQDVSPLPCGILPANACELGTRIKIEASGHWSATGTPTLVLGFYAGAVTATGAGSLTSILAETGAITLSATTDIPWHLDYTGIVTATGSTGSITGSGVVDMGSSLTAIASTSAPITLALRTVALNTSISNAIGVCATFSASSASNIVRVYHCTPLLLN